MRMVEGRTVFVTTFNKKYGARILKYPSRYGAQNEYEYFAESFASMTGGRSRTRTGRR